MITFTGIITLVGLYLPYSEKVAKLPDDAYAQVSPFKKGKKDDTPAPYLADMNALATTAKTAWQVKGDYTLSSVRVDNLGKAGSSTIFELANAKQLSKIATFISFDRTGNIEGQTGVIPSGVALQNAMIGLHRANFADLWLRYLFFGLGMAGTAMIASGLVLWTVKRRTDYAKQSYLGFKLVESLNIAAIAGLPVATATFLWANRLLPALKDRADTEISLFFGAWAVCALLAIALPKKQAWIVILWLSAALFALLPLINTITTNRGFVTSVVRGDFVFVVMDFAFIGFAWLFWHIGKRVQTHSDKPKNPKKPLKKSPTVAPVSTNTMTNDKTITAQVSQDVYKKGGYG